ncbi:MAG: hypothetical protein IJ445_03840 [Clostridia bacterium]|nr:hypothetical protein [Clostridia bacterium]
MKKFLSFLLTFAMLLTLAVPAMAVEPTVSGNTSGDVSASYIPSNTEDTTPAEITNVSITVDSVTYTTGNVTITPTSTVILTVTGTNLHNGSDDHTVDYANGLYLYVNLDYFEISADGTTATYTTPAEDFARSSNFEIKYCNNHTDVNNRTIVPTGIYLTYDDGIAEEDNAQITGMSITIDGVVYDSSNTSAENPAVITPNTEFITLTVHGTALQNCTVDNIVAYYAGASQPILSDYLWRFEADGTTAYRYFSSASALSKFAYNTTPYELQYTNNGSFSAVNPAIGSGVYIVYDDGTAEPTYTITVDKYGEGAVEVSASAAEGETVTVTLDPAEGYTGLNFKVVQAENNSTVEFTKVDDTTYTFVMPAANVVVSANFCLPGTELETIYYKGPWTNVQFEFVTSAGLAVGGAVGTIEESGIYAVSDIPEWSYTLVIRNLADTNEFIIIESIPTDGRNMYNAVTDEWETYTPSIPEVTSAEIVWGSMSFTYDDTIDEASGEERGWTVDDEEGAGTVTVKNTGNTAISASAVYTPVEGYDEITGTLGEAKTVAATEDGTFTLTLSGKPDKAIPAGTKIGSVTITINKAAEG